MDTRAAFLALWLALVAAAAPARAQINGCTPNLTGAVYYVIKTPLGDIPVQLYPNTAPQTVTNFRNYADRGDWNGSLVHRSVPGFVIQGGGFREVGWRVRGDPDRSAGRQRAVPLEHRGHDRDGADRRAAEQRDRPVVREPGQQHVARLGRRRLHRVRQGGGERHGGGAADRRAAALRHARLSPAPVQSDLPRAPGHVAAADPPGGYGCSRASPVFGLYAEPPASGFITDPTRSGSAVVPILLDRQCTGAGATGPPDVPCTSSRTVYEINLAAQQVISGPYSMTCSAVSESEDSWAARRAGTNTQLHANDFAVISVPEPSRWWMQAAAIALLALLKRGRAGGGAASQVRRCQRRAGSR
jgi:cyclophilin family peptidyl-prolyl cis-trans isomerase